MSFAEIRKSRNNYSPQVIPHKKMLNSKKINSTQKAIKHFTPQREHIKGTKIIIPQNSSLNFEHSKIYHYRKTKPSEFSKRQIKSLSVNLWTQRPQVKNRANNSGRFIIKFIFVK